MKGNRGVVAAILALVLLAAGWWLFRRGDAAEPINLLAQYDAARKLPAPANFERKTAELSGESRDAIAVLPAPGTRLIYKVTVPEDAWLRLWVGVQPDAWKQEGDGVQFRIGVSDGRAYEPLVTQHLHPFANSGDRAWVPVMVDLSTYSGETIDLIFNTDASQPGKPLDERGDFALWGAPEIIVR